MHRKET